MYTISIQHFTLCYRYVHNFSNKLKINEQNKSVLADNVISLLCFNFYRYESIPTKILLSIVFARRICSGSTFEC